MASANFQRVGIWVIVIVLTVGTLGSFAALILSNQNTATDQSKSDALTKEYSAYQAKVAAQATDLSNKYYGDFNQYAALPASFDATDIADLQTQDIKVGDGDTLTADSSYSAYYIGWNPTGKVFDESIDGSSLKAPLAVTASTGLITGWKSGVIGMKMGGVRELTIPSAQAYGTTGSGADIPANTPLKFVIMVIPTPAAVPIPDDLKAAGVTAS